jgi:pimeloyl-ACP methyl ester carboxylesterase
LRIVARATILCAVQRTVFVMWALVSCASPMSPHATEPVRSRENMLITYQGPREIGRERSRDDGNVLASDIALAGQTFSIEIDRAARRVRVVQGEHRIERQIADGEIALENGHWQAYAIAAEQFAGATEPREVTVLLPASGIRVPATITVRAHEEGRRVELTIQGMTVIADVVGGVVTHASVAAQGLDVRRAEDPAPAPRTAPEGIAEEPFEVVRDGVAIRGSLWLPANAHAVPIALLIAGSGPTDREGNSRLGLQTDCYRMIAEGLARRGIATLRYDKRGVGESGTNFDVAALTLGDFVDDARAIVERLRQDRRFVRLSVIGHSEGGLIALELAERVPIDALVLVATAGRPFHAVLREQLGRQLPESTMNDYERLLGGLRAGQPLERVPRELEVFFRPAIVAFARSIIDVDPVALLHRLRIPVAIVQGETDIQVSVADARALAAARSDAHLALLAHTNHVLKEEASATPAQTSYADPSRPLAAGVLDAIATGVAH